MSDIKCCDSCGKELTKDQLDENYLLNLPMLFCPRCYQVKDLILNDPKNNNG